MTQQQIYAMQFQLLARQLCLLLAKLDGTILDGDAITELKMKVMPALDRCVTKLF